MFKNYSTHYICLIQYIYRQVDPFHIKWPVDTIYLLSLFFKFQIKELLQSCHNTKIWVATCQLKNILMRKKKSRVKLERFETLPFEEHLLSNFTAFYLFVRYFGSSWEVENIHRWPSIFQITYLSIQLDIQNDFTSLCVMWLMLHSYWDWATMQFIYDNDSWPLDSIRRDY